MDRQLAKAFAPNAASMGYALFLAINAAGVWGGVFPFLPLEFQTREIIFWFFLSESLVYFAAYAASAVGAYYLPQLTRKFLVKTASVPYFVGWCLLIAAIYLDAAATTCSGSVSSRARTPTPARATSWWARPGAPCSTTGCTSSPRR